MALGNTPQGAPKDHHSPLREDRRRLIPKSGFSWIDRAFVRDGHLERLSSEGALLYFFLVSVADREGLSFWGDRRLGVTLRLDVGVLKAARAELERADLIAYRYPLYQVLSLPEPATPSKRPPLNPILRELP